MRDFYFLILVGFVLRVSSWPAYAAGTNAEKEQEMLTKGKPKYRVIYNYDSGPVFYMKEPSTMPQNVESMVDEVAGGDVDVLLICSNDKLAVYPSKVWQTFWDGFKEGDRSFFGDIPEKEIEQRTVWVRNMATLAKHGDYLAIAFARCREHGIAPGVSIRMNDMHDQPWPDSHLHSRFYKENPQLHLKPLGGRGWGGTGLDYAHRQVREHYLALIRELAEGYDLDVMELDFMRFPYYFDQDNIDRHCATMTGFIREVRQILDSTGRHIVLIPRVASSPGAARQLGFDVQAWAREGLVDGVTTANMLTTSWDVDVEKFRELVGPGIAVYASMSVAADGREGLPTRYIPEDYKMLRGFAAGYLASGADGINTFNFFLARQHRPVTAEQFYGGLRELRSLEQARNKPRIHVLSAGWRVPECDSPEVVPATIRVWRDRRFEMLLAAEGEGAKVTVLVYFDGENKPEDLWLRIGYHPIGHAVEIRRFSAPKEGEKPKRNAKIAVFKIPANVITDGRNQLVIRSDRVSTTILGIDVDIR